MSIAAARPFGLAVLTGLLYPLCFPDFNLGFLAWLVLIPLHLALDETTVTRSFWLGWLAGWIGFIGVMSWVVTAMHQYGKMPLVASYPAMWLLAAYLGVYVALYAAGFTWLRLRVPAYATLGTPCLWVALEWLRAHFLSGLPWMLLGYSQHQWLLAIQIADITGIYGISFLIVVVNVSLSEISLWTWSRLSHTSSAAPFPRLSTAMAILMIVGTLLYGQARLSESHVSDPARSVAIGVIQPNIDQAHKWDQAYRRDTLDRYAGLTVQAAHEVDLLLWPEAATPFFFEEELLYRAEVTVLVREQGVPLLFGSPALRRYPNGRPYLLNSAYLLSPQGQIIGRYDKRHLVPFGEYIPLHGSVLFFLDKLVEGIGDFEAGTVPTVFSLPPKAGSPSASTNQPTFSVAICYEVIFPHLIREFVVHGADFMTTITNDAWFGASSAPSQHFAMVVFRSVENRVGFARSANTGISGFIDPWGRVLEATPIFTEQTAIGRLPIRGTRSFYTQYGDVFAYGCVIITAILFSAAYWRRRHARRASHAPKRHR